MKYKVSQKDNKERERKMSFIFIRIKVKMIKEDKSENNIETILTFLFL